jgi:two-component system chemotaxis sensor kinase CheA
MNPLLAQFISEARDLLEQTSSGFLRLEKDPENAECINDIFRAVHTLKGTSGLFAEYISLTQTVHAAEDVLDRIRQGEAHLTPEMTDLFLECHDLVLTWVDEIETTGELPSGASVSGKRLADLLRLTLNTGPATTDVSEDVPAENGTESVEWLHELPTEQLAIALARSTNGEQVFAVNYRPDENCLFSGEDPLQLIRQVPELIALQIKPREAFPSFAELDYYRCILDFRGLTVASRDDLEHHFRYVSEQAEIVELTHDSFIPRSPELTEAEEQHREHEQKTFGFVLEQQRLALGSPVENETQKRTRILSVSQTLLNTLTFMQMPAWHAAIEAARSAALAASDLEPLKKALDELIDGNNEVNTNGTMNTIRPPQIEAAPAAETAASNGNGNGNSNPNGNGQARSLKIDPAKIDQLMDLIGELVIAKNGLPYVASRADKHFGVPELAHEIKAQYAVIDRISDSLYQSIMQVRMLPVSFVFNRFPRLVRDLAQKLGKDIHLILEGEETEADKNIVEKLADPLIHIVRNSIDHGFEMPEQRLRLGKPASGTLRLRAFQESDLVCIEITDDGKGIDPEQIKTKAYEKGLIDETALETISDREAIQLIFAPGFSTIEQVTDLSGRGVGMDVVRRAVAAAGGTVTLESTKGVGTRIQINLPLTMAVSRILIVGQGKEVFGVPMDAIVETLRVPRDAFSGLKDHEIMMWRGQLIPVERLSELLNLEPHIESNDQNDDVEEAVLVIRQNGEDVGVVVGSFHERVDTILKPLDGIMAGLTGYSGTAILGDGRVVLILNFKELL